MHLALMLIHLPLDILLGLRLSLLDLPQELFLFKRNSFSLELYSLQFFSVFLSQFIVLAFSILELLGLHLVLLIDRHYRF